MASVPSRRDVLRGVGAFVGAFATASTLDLTASGASILPGDLTAQWVRGENVRPGDGSWLRGVAATAGDLEGYASATSINLGQTITFFVSTTSPTYSIKVYRMGYYQGLGARLIETRLDLTGHARPMPTPDQYGTVDCRWPASFRVVADERYAPGQYLVRLENTEHQFRFVPFLVRDDSSRAAFVYMSSVTTWQAYNTWGGFSLYRQATPVGSVTVSDANRAVRVSFNRPYDRAFANGAADFVGNEFPLLFLAEQLGLDLTYWTDIDLHERGASLTRHRALLSLGHDEYYSPAMRAAVVNGVDHGVNVAFFGANFCYRKIRFEPSVNGADRLMINYRSTADPITATNPSLATVNWSQYPSDTPESTFTGSIYGGVDGTGSLSVVDAGAWFWRGTGVRNGSVLAGALGGEFNHYNPAVTNPANVQILGHSNVGGGISDVTYVAEPGQGGVFASGTGHWVFDLSDAPRLGNFWVPAAIPGVTNVIRRATINLLARFGAAPAGTTTPSVANTNQY